jgi:regulator of protease activity HflC (stomatin/prohibitin superfamily)
MGLIIIVGIIIAIVCASNESPVGAVLSLVGTVVVAGFFTVANTITQIPAGNAGVGVWFGSVQQSSIPEGLHMVNPMLSIETFPTRRETVDFGAKDTGHPENPINGPALLLMSGDQNPLSVSVSFPYNLNEQYMWMLYEHVGTDQARVESKLIETNARKIAGEVFARHGWVEETISARSQVETEMQQSLQAAIVADLQNYGFTEAQAKAAITFSQPQLREVKPDDKILNSIAEKLAAQQDLERQKTLTQIAEQVAIRRKNEGVGITNLFDALPKGFKADEIATVLRAIASKEQADALNAAVANNKISVMVLPSTTPLAVQGQ